MLWTQDEADTRAIELAYQGVDHEADVRRLAGTVLAGEHDETRTIGAGRIVHIALQMIGGLREIQLRLPTVGPEWARRRVVEEQLRQELTPKP